MPYAMTTRLTISFVSRLIVWLYFAIYSAAMHFRFYMLSYACRCVCALHIVCCTIIFIIESVSLIDVATGACVFAYACIVCKCFRSLTNQKHHIHMHNTTFMWHSILIHWFFSALAGCALVVVSFYYLSSMCNWNYTSNWKHAPHA